MGIVEFLEARIAEDEARADAIHSLATERYGGVPVYRNVSGSPARILREVAAKRELLELHYDGNPGPGDVHYCGTCHDYYMHQAEDWPCETVRVLASAFSDHPDFDEEWRP